MKRQKQLIVKELCFPISGSRTYFYLRMVNENTVGFVALFGSSDYCSVIVMTCKVMCHLTILADDLYCLF